MINFGRFARFCLYAILVQCPAIESLVVGQAPSSAPAPAQSAYQAETVAVLVDVIVTDKQGRPITDLKLDEFTVLEDGVPQRIRSAVFESQTDSDLLPQAPGQAPATVPRKQAPPKYVCLLFDDSRMALQSRASALRAARDVVDKWPLDSQISVFALRGGVLSLVHQPTTDRVALSKAISQLEDKKFHPYATSSAELNRLLAEGALKSDAERLADAEVATSKPALNEEVDLSAILIGTFRQFEVFEREVEAQRSVIGLLSMIHSVQSLPGRKAVIYLSEGFPVNSKVEAQYRTVIASANRANVAIYTIDTAGLRLESEISGSSRELSALGNARSRSDPSLLTGGETALGRVDQLGRYDETGVLSELAESTGGLALRKSNDIKGALLTIKGDIGAYYLLSYVPSNLTMDGSFRKLEVKVSRPDANVRARSGYDALPLGDVGPQMDYERPLWQAFAEKQGIAPALPVNPAVWRFPADRGADWLLVTAQIPASALKFSPAQPPQETKERKKKDTQEYLGAKLAVMALAEDASHFILNKKSQWFELSVSASQLEDVRKAHVGFRRRMLLPLQPCSMTLLARDDGSGVVTAVKLDAPAATGAPQGLRLSTIVPVGGVEPLGEGAPTDDPLVYNGAQITPQATGRFIKGVDSQMRFYFSALTAPGAAVRAKVQFLQRGAVIAEAPGDLPPADQRGMVRFLSEFPLAPFPPGDYAIRVTLESDGKKLAQETKFSVTQ